MFEDDADLGKKGRVRYEPYRSGSHYDMVQTIKKTGFAIIEVDDRGVRRMLKIARVEYGTLDILEVT